jgi:hypothetical protein
MARKGMLWPELSFLRVLSITEGALQSGSYSRYLLFVSDLLCSVLFHHLLSLVVSFVFVLPSRRSFAIRKRMVSLWQ